MAYFVLTVAIVLLCGPLAPMVHTQILTGYDSEDTDTFGTRFVFPSPVCESYNEYYKVQILPRATEPLATAIFPYGMNLFDNPDLPVIRGVSRSGNSTTMFVPCNVFSIEEQIISNEKMALHATAEVTAHVMLRNDSYMLLPINVLGTEHALLSLATEGYSYFVSVASVNDSIVNITREDSTPVEVDVQLSMKDVYTFTSPSPLTGLRVSSDEPVMVIAGLYLPDKPWAMMVEHVLPTRSWGKRYMLGFPNKWGPLVTLRVAAYALKNEFAEIRILKNHVVSKELPTNGAVIDLTSHFNKSGGHVTMNSTSVHFQVLVFMISSRFQSPYDHFPDYRLHALYAPVSLDLSMDESCLPSHLNYMYIMTMVLGNAQRKDLADGNQVLRDTRAKFTLDVYWIRAYFSSSSWDLTMRLNVSKRKGSIRMWFHEQVVMKRGNAMYFLNSAHNMLNLNLNLNSPCLDRTNIDPEPDDLVDNDCDGRVDEELVNKIDDDGDLKIDEDTASSGAHIRNCSKDRTPYFWEPNRYRNTRYEKAVYEFAARLPEQSWTMVMVSASVALAMVFTFSGIVFCLDRIHYFRYPYDPPKIF